MQLRALAAFSFVAVGTVIAADDSVQDLISQIPSCATSCLDKASKAVGCAAGDNKCQCGKMDDLSQEALPCVSTSCEPSDLSTVTELSAKICAKVAVDAGGAAASSLVSSATGALGSAIGATATGASASASATSTPSATPGAGSRAGVGMGLAAAMAALAL
ncbi:hypothetical protein F4779DRAFT_335518 [Xylariaceae sp. FL0662B]|nr:hypothetical protein F4779DRAFT_335518 [Xylariaceae sp. FL0662B]